MSTAFGHALDTYPDYASQIIFELWKNQTENRYFVRMRINDKNVILKHDCLDQLDCDFSKFEGLAAKVAFYNDAKGYQKWCNRTPNLIAAEVIA